MISWQCSTNCSFYWP